MKLFYRYRNYIDNNDRTCILLKAYKLVRVTELKKRLIES